LANGFGCAFAEVAADGAVKWQVHGEYPPAECWAQYGDCGR
jgi:hypothetical protein